METVGVKYNHAMKMLKICGMGWLPAVLLLAWAGMVKADDLVQADDFIYTTNASHTSIIIGYTGTNVVLTIPGKTNGLTIIGIAKTAFYCHTNLTSVTIPDSVTGIGDGAFDNCTSLTNVIIGSGVTIIGLGAFDCCPLTSVYFKGSLYRYESTPMIYPSAFANATNATFYYLSGTTGWSTNFAGRPTKERKLP